MHQSVFFVGTTEEIEHHAAPLTELPYEVVSPECIVARARPGDLAIFYSEHFDRFRNACNQLKTNNVATLYMVDGILEWRNAWENREDEPACPWTMRPVLCHKVACIGPSQARTLASWGNEAKIEITGVPRFEALKNQRKELPERNPGEWRVLVMTAKCPGFTDEQVVNTRKGLLALKRWFTDRPNPAIQGREVKVVWRLTQDLDKEMGVENSLRDLTGNDLASTLATVDGVITTPSTSILEAMLFDLPVATLDFNNSPSYVQTAWQITAESQIDTVLKQMACPSEPRMFFQRAILSDTLCQSNAIERFTHLAQTMLKIAAEQVANKKALAFPENILKYAENSEFPVFQHEKIFSKTREFSIVDRRQLQSELGHARREIDHLHRQIQQLRSELGEAHEIFDQIQQHPIAGPVVRARQKLIDWYAAFKVKKPTSLPGDSHPGTDSSSSNSSQPTP